MNGKTNTVTKSKIIKFDDIVNTNRYFASFSDKNFDTSKPSQNKLYSDISPSNISDAIKDAYSKKNNSKYELLFCSFLGKVLEKNKYVFLGPEMDNIDLEVNHLKSISGISELVDKHEGKLENQVQFSCNPQDVKREVQFFNYHLRKLLQEYGVPGTVKLEVEQTPNTLNYLS